MESNVIENGMKEIPSSVCSFLLEISMLSFLFFFFFGSNNVIFLLSVSSSINLLLAYLLVSHLICRHYFLPPFVAMQNESRMFVCVRWCSGHSGWFIFILKAFWVGPTHWDLSISSNNGDDDFNSPIQIKPKRWFSIIFWLKLLFINCSRKLEFGCFS